MQTWFKNKRQAPFHSLKIANRLYCFVVIVAAIVVVGGNGDVLVVVPLSHYCIQTKELLHSIYYICLCVE